MKTSNVLVSIYFIDLHAPLKTSRKRKNKIDLVGLCLGVIKAHAQLKIVLSVSLPKSMACCSFVSTCFPGTVLGVFCAFCFRRKG